MRTSTSQLFVLNLADRELWCGPLCSSSIHRHKRPTAPLPLCSVTILAEMKGSRLPPEHRHIGVLFSGCSECYPRKNSTAGRRPVFLADRLHYGPIAGPHDDSILLSVVAHSYTSIASLGLIVRCGKQLLSSGRSRKLCEHAGLWLMHLWNAHHLTTNTV